MRAVQALCVSKMVSYATYRIIQLLSYFCSVMYVKPPPQDTHTRTQTSTVDYGIKEKKMQQHNSTATQPFTFTFKEFHSYFPFI